MKYLVHGYTKKNYSLFNGTYLYSNKKKKIKNPKNLRKGFVVYLKFKAYRESLTYICQIWQPWTGRKEQSPVRCALLLLLNRQAVEDESGLRVTLLRTSENPSQGAAENRRLMLKSSWNLYLAV